ncbi:hypothetical protein BH23PLA1_BH23PLA1_16560 [soil metagenome]
MAQNFASGFDDWQPRLAHIVSMMRELSRQNDPQEMVRAYGRQMREILPTDRLLSLSRRDLPAPYFRITRSSTWQDEINPWTQKQRLPVLEGGLLGDLIYGEEPRIIGDLQVSPEDPAAEYLRGMGSALAIPNYDRGEALNMVVLFREAADAFSPEQLPELVWMSNLFGRATHNLVLSEELRKVNEALEDDLEVVADIQRSLLPARLPRVPTLDLAAYYETSRHAGGDYYDLFPLAEGRWGLIIADVSGHGTPAAVMMAITHALAHAYTGEPIPPNLKLEYLNNHLAHRYTTDSGAFVTAFYGIYDPSTRVLSYSSAGHNPPRLKRCAGGQLLALESARGFPLGLFEGQSYEQEIMELRPGDQLVFYTDGITEANNPAGKLFDVSRLDESISQCRGSAEEMVQAILEALDVFTAGQPADDDRTLLVAKIT